MKTKESLLRVYKFGRDKTESQLTQIVIAGLKKDWNEINRILGKKYDKDSAMGRYRWSRQYLSDIIQKPKKTYVNWIKTEFNVYLTQDYSQNLQLIKESRQKFIDSIVHKPKKEEHLYFDKILNRYLPKELSFKEKAKGKFKKKLKYRTIMEFPIDFTRVELRNLGRKLHLSDDEITFLRLKGIWNKRLLIKFLCKMKKDKFGRNGQTIGYVSTEWVKLNQNKEFDDLINQMFEWADFTISQNYYKYQNDSEKLERILEVHIYWD